MSDQTAITEEEYNTLNGILTHLKEGTRSPLELYCLTKQIDVACKEAQERLKVAANEEFVTKSQDKDKVILNDLAVVSRATPRGSWTLSPELVQKSNELKAEVDTFKKNNKATAYVAGDLNPKTHSLFRVSLI